ncbi:MAG: hypothetical protein ABII02_04065 [Candidatus Magasanikbacteria bacterium]
MKKFLIPASFFWAATCLVVGVLMVSFTVYEYSFNATKFSAQTYRIVQSQEAHRLVENNNLTNAIVTIGDGSVESFASEADIVQTRVSVN